MTQDDDGDSWRDYFARLGLILDQTSVYCMSGNSDLARRHVDEARGLVDMARTRLDSEAGPSPRFSPVPDAGPPLESEVLSVLGPLTDALDSRDAETKRTAIAALERWLPRLRREDQARLNRAQRANLCRVLQIEFALENSDLVVAATQALTRIEDMGALKHIQRLADCAAVTRGGKRVKAEAQACRVALEALKARADMNQNLLRAAASPQTSAALLRPAGTSDDDTSDLLLRPAD